MFQALGTKSNRACLRWVLVKASHSYQGLYVVVELLVVETLVVVKIEAIVVMMAHLVICSS